MTSTRMMSMMNFDPLPINTTTCGTHHVHTRTASTIAACPTLLGLGDAMTLLDALGEYPVDLEIPYTSHQSTTASTSMSTSTAAPTATTSTTSKNEDGYEYNEVQDDAGQYGMIETHTHHPHTTMTNSSPPMSSNFCNHSINDSNNSMKRIVSCCYEDETADGNTTAYSQRGSSGYYYDNTRSYKKQRTTDMSCRHNNSKNISVMQKLPSTIYNSTDHANASFDPPVYLPKGKFMESNFRSIQRDSNDGNIISAKKPPPAPPFKKTKATKVSENKNRNNQMEAVDNNEENELEEDGPTFSSFQIDRWDERFKELVQYKQEYGHCCVPNNWNANYQLAQWVKRQRYQYRIKKGEGRTSSSSSSSSSSTLTEARQEALDQLGFVWDLHAAVWEERLSDLHTFRRKHGHSKVPIRYTENPELAIWAKCQRRHFRNYCEARDSGREWNSNTMTQERIMKLMDAGFVFANRQQPKGRQTRHE